MKFRLEHRFAIPRDLFERYLNDPELIEMSRTLPNLANRELLDFRQDGDRKIWRFKNAAISDIPAAARAVVKPEMLSWIEHSAWDPAQHSFEWWIEAPHFAKKFEARGTWDLFEDGPGRTRRVIEGDLRVKVPLFGGVVEEFVVALIRSNYEAEADVQRRFYAKKAAEEAAGGAPA